MIELGVLRVGSDTAVELDLGSGNIYVEFKVRGNHGIFASHLAKFTAAFETDSNIPADPNTNFYEDGDIDTIDHIDKIQNDDKTKIYFKCESGATGHIEYRKIKLKER